jgi:ribosomal protein L11 methyltransferase
MKRIEVDFRVTASTTSPLDSRMLCDMLVASLAENGSYDAFEDTPNGLKAYVDANLFDASVVHDLCEELKADGADCTFSVIEHPDKDYNEIWERQHEAVMIGDWCCVRAHFHPKPLNVKYDIVIDPKMSFGTAHHATTHLMLSFLGDEPVAGRRVLDMGSGTGVLAILAAMKGAAYVEAVDVDEWAWCNAQENFETNGVKVYALLGDASILTPDKSFDVILANINRNILLRDMPSYVAVLAQGGALMLSGFYQSDIPVLRQKAESLGLLFSRQQSRDDWAALRFEKK